MTDIEKIVITAINLAKKFRHEYVTIEHLSAVILDDPEVQAMCYEVQADHEQLQIALVNYLEHECKELIKNNLSLPAYENCIKASHYFNILDSRGVIGVTQRQKYILKIRALVKSCCELYIKQES